jgi:hypothetical protein
MAAKRRALDEIANNQRTADEKRKDEAERQAKTPARHLKSALVQ